MLEAAALPGRPYGEPVPSGEPPFGGMAASGTGSRFGGALANIDAFTETRWMTVRSRAATFPF